MSNPIKPIREIKQVPNKKSIWPAVSITIIILVILTVAMVTIIEKYYSDQRQANRKVVPTPTITIGDINIPVTNTPIPQLSPTVNPVVTPTEQTEAGIPEMQNIYYGQVDDKMGYFVTNKEMQKFVQGSKVSINAYRGQVTYVDGNFDMNFDFRRMKNAKVVMKTDDILINGVVPAIGHQMRNDKTGMLYLILNTVGNRPKEQYNIACVLYRVDLYYGRVRKIMTQQVGAGVPQKGIVTISQIWHDDYVVLKIDNCINCANKEPFNYVLVNVNTYAFKYLGTVTDIREDAAKSSYSYRRLVAVKEPCTSGDTNCDALGEKTVYKPSATAIVGKLF